jgi:hypothetical protein
MLWAPVVRPVQLAEAAARPQRSARLLALFWWQGRELALVRLFEDAPHDGDDDLASRPWSCRALRWQARGSLHGGREPLTCGVVHPGQHLHRPRYAAAHAAG